jgi:hypothetical protein
LSPLPHCSTREGPLLEAAYTPGSSANSRASERRGDVPLVDRRAMACRHDSGKEVMREEDSIRGIAEQCRMGAAPACLLYCTQGTAFIPPDQLASHQHLHYYSCIGKETHDVCNWTSPLPCPTQLCCQSASPPAAPLCTHHSCLRGRQCIEGICRFTLQRQQAWV